jgi:hypothetical protein
MKEISRKEAEWFFRWSLGHSLMVLALVSYVVDWGSTHQIVVFCVITLELLVLNLATGGLYNTCKKLDKDKNE